MKRKEIIFIAILFLALNTLSAQQVRKDSVLSFSLKQAQDYALQNSPLVKNANLDVLSAKKKIWETTAIGLPQVNSKLSYSYMLTVPSLISEINSFSSLGTNFSLIYSMLGSLGYQTGNPYVNHVIDSLSHVSSSSESTSSSTSINDMRWGLTYDITASEIIFNGAYIVGLQTSKIFKQLSELGVNKSQNDVTEQVTDAYYLVLIAQENLDILDSTYANTERLFNFTNTMNKQGFVEESDVDQATLSLGTLKTTKDMLLRQTELAKDLLKFQMGIDINKQITLTGNLTKLIETTNMASLLVNDFKVENNSDYKLMETQEKLSGLNVKLQKSSFLPDIAAFYTHEENFNKNSFSFTPPNLVGFSVNIPIFGSGMKIAKTSEAMIGLEKARNSKDEVALGLQTTFIEAKSSYETAVEKYQTSKKNVGLAEKIYNKNIVKYKEGTIGSMELTQAQNQYLQSQTTYYSSITELITAKSKLEKLLK